MRALRGIALLLWLAGPALAAPEPRVRIEIEGAQRVLVGQQVRVNVTVLAPNYFLSAPEFPHFDIAGAVVTLLDETALNSTETIEGASYAGIRRSYAITPQGPGDFTLPPARITFRYAAEPGAPAVAAAVTLPPQVFTARLPEGAVSAGAPVLVAKVTVTQKIDGDPKAMRVGDALTRTVETVAANTQAMMIPPPEFAVPAGARVYPRDPVLSDVTTGRGGFVGGRRVDSATYVFEQPGDITLPAIEIGWFNPDTGKQEIARAPQIVASVAPVAAGGSELAPPTPTQHSPGGGSGVMAAWPWALTSALALAVTGAAFAASRRFGPSIRARVREHRQASQTSEAATFARLRRACSVSDAATAYRELGAWARLQGFGSVDRLRAQEAALRDAIAALERRLFAASGPPTWDGRALIAAAAEVRNARRARGIAFDRRPSALPTLNP